ALSWTRRPPALAGGARRVPPAAPARRPEGTRPGFGQPSAAPAVPCAVLPAVPAVRPPPARVAAPAAAPGGPAVAAAAAVPAIHCTYRSSFPPSARPGRPPLRTEFSSLS